METTDLLALAVKALEKLRIEYCVTGSIASMTHGEARFTNDIDIVTWLRPADVSRFCQEFPPPEFYCSESAAFEAVATQRQFNIIHPASGLKIDFMIPDESEFNRSRRDRKQLFSVTSDVNGYFASPEDVIIKKLDYFKQGASEKHIRDIRGIMRVRGSELDLIYIRHWCGKLALTEQWDHVLELERADPPNESQNRQIAEIMTHSFRTRLKQNQTLLGTMVTLPTPITAEILCDMGFDWLFLDAEHGPLETAELLAILQVVGKRVPCLVRVPEAAEVPIKKALDLGAAGIIAPQTNTVEAVENVVRWARYSPDGARGVGIGRAHAYGMNFADYVARANETVAVVVQAEHIEAVNNIEQIVKVPGVDAVLLGPYDLSASMGKMGQVDDPEVLQAIDHVTKTCQSAGIPLGYFGVSADAVKPYLDQGYSLIVAGVDTIMLGTTAARLLGKLREA